MNMLKYKILFLLTITAFSSMEQPDPAVVIAVEKGNAISLKSFKEMITNSKLFDNMDKTLKALEKAQKLNNVIQDLATVKKLYDVVESTACVYKQFEQVMELSGGINYDDCFINFKYEMSITKNIFSMELLQLVLSNLNQTLGDRNQSLKDVLDVLETNTNDMMQLTNSLKRGLMLNLDRDIDNAINKMYYNPYKNNNYQLFNI